MVYHVMKYINFEIYYLYIENGLPIWKLERSTLGFDFSVKKIKNSIEMIAVNEKEEFHLANNEYHSIINGNSWWLKFKHRNNLFSEETIETLENKLIAEQEGKINFLEDKIKLQEDYIKSFEKLKKIFFSKNERLKKEIINLKNKRKIKFIGGINE